MAEDEQNPSTGAAADPGADAVPAQKRRRRVRALLLALGPVVVLVVGTYVYMNTGRYAETDNAYVKSDRVLISPEVAGPIASIRVRENEHVEAGDVLFEIDASPYRLAVERGKSQVEAVKSFIEGLEASYRQQLEQLELAKINIAYNERELKRQQGLAARNLASDVDVDSAKHDYDVAKQQVPIIEQALAQLRAQIGGEIAPGLASVATGTALSVPFTGNAALRTTKAMLEDAELDLEHTTVHAPFAGVVSHVPTVGGYVAPGTPVMSLVADHDVWIEANYKETELTHVKPGQSVSIRVDTYPGVELHGEVQSISPATGAEFSVIPAQNASGNWVKVTQRIPVRISVDVRSGDPELRAGMSTVVAIDTGYQRKAPRFLSFLRMSSAASAAPAVERH